MNFYASSGPHQHSPLTSAYRERRSSLIHRGSLTDFKVILNWRLDQNQERSIAFMLSAFAFIHCPFLSYHIQHCASGVASQMSRRRYSNQKFKSFADDITLSKKRLPLQKLMLSNKLIPSNSWGTAPHSKVSVVRREETD